MKEKWLESYRLGHPLGEWRAGSVGGEKGDEGEKGEVERLCGL